MAKSEISWSGVTPEGSKRQVYAERVGNRWRFYEREKRFEQWQPVEHPAREDWLELLDAVQRRIHRRLLPPEEEGRLKKTIREMYPETGFTE